MEHWIPVLVAGVGPVTLGVILFVYHKPIKSILDILGERIRKGAAFTTPWGSVGADTNVASPLAFRSSDSDSTASDISAQRENVGFAAAVFPGVCLEIRLNEEIAESIHGDLNNLLRGAGLIPLRRLNESSTAGLIQRPPVPINDPIISLAWIYLQEIRILNRIVDSIDSPIAPDAYTRARITQALPLRDRLRESGSRLQAALAARMRSE
jgi:hypothetical protein